jgi:hypothetical protein
LATNALLAWSLPFIALYALGYDILALLFYLLLAVLGNFIE